MLCNTDPLRNVQQILNEVIGQTGVGDGWISLLRHGFRVQAALNATVQDKQVLGSTELIPKCRYGEGRSADLCVFW